MSIHLDDTLGDASQQSQIPADVWLHIQRGDLRSEEQTERITRNTEVDQSRFNNRIDHNDVPATAADMLQGGHQARVVAGGISTDDKHQIRVLNIFQ